MTQDNGALGIDLPNQMHMPWGSHYVSDVLYAGDARIATPYVPKAMGGDFLVGEVHESWIGDQNGNGIVEWLVFFLYFPWFEDDIDNDGDGCVDERIIKGAWDGHVNCDSVPDAVVLYETGGNPILGGDNADLFVSLDWYSGIERVEVFRAFASIPWNAYRMRSVILYPQIAGEFISYYAQESINNINANPEMDSDRYDWYVGNIDARRFPRVAPINYVCSAGYQSPSGSTFKRSDGWVVTSFELSEHFDDHDWNGDGDTSDRVAAYYAIDPNSGKCRENVVNTGVSGVYPRNTGLIMTPGHTYQNTDSRDWNQNGNLYEYSMLYHDINSTWSMKGRAYISFTFTSPVPPWGFGWSAIYTDDFQSENHPLEHGGSYVKYVGPMNGYYHSYFFLTSDEDGDRHTELPGYFIDFGRPVGTLAGRCVVILARELFMEYAGVDLIGNQADGNGDGDTSDVLGFIYCPNKSGGGGNYVIEPTSKYAQGLYSDPIPFIWLGNIFNPVPNEYNGYSTLIIYRTGMELHDDCDGRLQVTFSYCYVFYTVALPPLGDDGQGVMPRGDSGGPGELQNSVVLWQLQSSGQSSLILTRESASVTKRF
jgi:hypothetical protein